MLLLLDLDRFKHVNYSLGHEVGDHLLTVVGARLATVDDESILAGRLGGNKFAVLTCVDNVDAARPWPSGSRPWSVSRCGLTGSAWM